MKIRKIIDICKKGSQIMLFETDSEQWISDGGAVYPMYNLPKFDEASLCRTYDITDKQAEKIHFAIKKGLPSAYDFSDFAEGENIVQRGSMSLSYAGSGIIPYLTSQGVAFIDAKYLQPLSDIQDGMLELYERQTAAGQIYFAAKRGLMLSAIILPLDVVDENFVKSLKKLTQQCEVALFNKHSDDEAAYETQQSIFRSEEK